MIDEFGNDCPYDFKNILFTEANKYKNVYTFNYILYNTNIDASLRENESCYNNTMKKYS